MAIPTFPNNWIYGDANYCSNRLTECTAASIVADPVILPDSTTFSGSQAVTITVSTSGATIYYTTDGSTPTSASTVYSGAFNVTATTTVKAIALLSGSAPSNVVSETYTLSVATATIYWGYSSSLTLNAVGVLALQGSASESDPYRQYVFDASSTVNDYFYWWWPATFSSPGATDGFEDDLTSSPIAMATNTEGFTDGPVNGWYYLNLTVNGVPGRLWRSFNQLGGGGAFTVSVNS
jgi:hypothetical protein